MTSGIPVRAIDRREVALRLTEPELAPPGQELFLAGENIDRQHDPRAVLENVVIDDAPAARRPLLAGRAMRILAGDIPRQHLFLARGALPNAYFTIVAVDRVRGVIENPATVRAFR